MRNLMPLLKQDIKFQFRHGFYMVYFIIALIYILLLKVLSDSVVSRVSVLIIFSDPTFIGFFFIGAILFFERDQRVTDALFVTPVTKGEYILSKGVSLTLLSLLVVTFITVTVHGIFINWLLLLPSITLTSTLFIFLGMLIARKINTITTYLIFGGLLLIPFCLPVINYFDLYESGLFYLFPTTGSIRLIHGSLEGGISLFDTLYSLLYLGVLNIITFKILLKVEGGNK